MPTPPSRHGLRALELLADGQWHRRERVVAEVAKTIPVGVALRHSEKIRQRAVALRVKRGLPVIADQGRKQQRSKTFLIATGAHRLAMSAFDRATIQKRTDENGVVWVRRTDVPLPSAPLHDPALPQPAPDLAAALPPEPDPAANEQHCT